MKENYSFSDAKMKVDEYFQHFVKNVYLLAEDGAMPKIICYAIWKIVRMAFQISFPTFIKMFKLFGRAFAKKPPPQNVIEMFPAEPEM